LSADTVILNLVVPFIDVVSRLQYDAIARLAKLLSILAYTSIFIIVTGFVAGV
jgi:hypothetical protein